MIKWTSLKSKTSKDTTKKIKKIITEWKNIYNTYMWQNSYLEYKNKSYRWIIKYKWPPHTRTHE